MTASIDELLAATQAYCAARGISEARLSTLMFNDGKRIAHLRAGGDVGSRRLPALFQWLSDRWPADAGWPDGVPRPEPRQPEAPQPEQVSP